MKNNPVPVKINLWHVQLGCDPAEHHKWADLEIWLWSQP